MNLPRIMLVGLCPRLTALIESHVKKALGRDVPACSADSLRDHVRPGEGMLLLAAGCVEADTVRRVVQQIALQQLPTPVLILESPPGSLPESLAELEPFVPRHLHWPAEAEELVSLVRAAFPRGRDQTDIPETVTDVIRRRLIGYTPSLLPLLERITLAAIHDVTVLLTGETGTGKTHVARLMHECSPRRGEPFLTVPCGAQPANLIESVFFGHVRGAFTGADRSREGKFAAAGKGTLLLDEIDTLPMEAQASLLRVIETGEFEPVGSNDTLHSQARIIVASNWDLEEATREGKFRPDLYYRLNVMSFHFPPLRERVQDISPLARALIARFAVRFHKPLFDVESAALAVLENFDWPGNIRQLENVVQQAVLVSKGPTLTVDDLPPLIRDTAPRPLSPLTRDALTENWENMERAVIQRALQANNFCRSRAASSLGISRVTLYKKMRKYGLEARPSA